MITSIILSLITYSDASNEYLSYAEMEIVKNETQLIRKKRAVTCPTSGPWIKNIYDECYQYVTEPKTYADAITHCINLDSKAHLPILVEGTRFIRLYSNIKENAYPGYDISSAQQYFWLDAQRTGTTDDGFAIFQYIDGSMVANSIYFVDDTNKALFNTGIINHRFLTIEKI